MLTTWHLCTGQEMIIKKISRLFCNWYVQKYNVKIINVKAETIIYK